MKNMYWGKVMNKLNFKGAIFDLDGTLLDSMHVWRDVDTKFFKKRNMEMPDDYGEALKNMHFPTAAVYTKERFNLPDTVESIMEEWTQSCFEAYEKHIKLKDGAKEYLELLKENNVKIAYATSNSEKLCKAVLSSNCVWEYFSAKAYSEETGKQKTEPDVYLLAAERLGIFPRDCIVFEDIIGGVQGAKKGGFRVCGVYDSTSEKDREQIETTADYYIESFMELL